ncbi:DUF3800 domain-containing protein [Cupriavidus sp. 8B]
MTSSFRAYIDESGDEGFKFLPNEQGSSRWFIQSATVVRTVNDLAMVQLVKDARALLNKQPKAPLHFRHLRHEHRVPLARLIGEAPLRHAHVLVHKPSISDPEIFQQEAYSLYRYTIRLLLERVSWLCRDTVRAGEGDGTAELIFSNRSAMSYDDLRQYMVRLQGVDECRIHWPSLDLNRVRAVNHDQLAGLQIADAVATSAFYAVNKSQYGETEDRYLSLIARNLYRARNGNADGYGLKFWCAADEERQRVLAAVRVE